MEQPLPPPPGPDSFGPRSTPGDGGMADETATEAVGHMQAAANELIAAARAFLDLFEDVVNDDETVASATDAIGSVARAMMKATRSATEYGSPDAGEPHTGSGEGVEHIRIT